MIEPKIAKKTQTAGAVAWYENINIEHWRHYFGEQGDMDVDTYKIHLAILAGRYSKMSDADKLVIHRAMSHGIFWRGQPMEVFVKVVASYDGEHDAKKQAGQQPTGDSHGIA